MSEATSRMQTPWEETDEEVKRRLRQAQSPDSGWFGTTLGLIVAMTALVALLWLH